MAAYDLIVIGEGIAGLTCANEAARAGLKVATFESNLFGGLVLNVNELEGYPEDRQTSGAEFASELMEKNASSKVASVQEAVGCRAAGRRTDSSVKTPGSSHTARRVVAASGARLKKLGVPGESEFEGRGVSSAPIATARCSRTRKWSWSAAATPRCRRRSCSPSYCGKVTCFIAAIRFRAQPHFVEQVSRLAEDFRLVENHRRRDTRRQDGREVRIRGTEDGQTRGTRVRRRVRLHRARAERRLRAGGHRRDERGHRGDRRHARNVRSGYPCDRRRAQRLQRAAARRGGGRRGAPRSSRSPADDK